MRLLLAGLLVFGTATFAAVGLLQVAPSLPPVIGGLCATLAGGLMAALALRFLNPGPDAARLTLARQIAELEEAGLVRVEVFSARRAFEVEELEDEGLHYFIELEDGAVLFLSGQYLYDYDPDFAGTRRMPCSRFEVRRHRVEGYALEIVCSGEVMEPEATAEPFREEDWDRLHLEDGAVIRDRLYEEVRKTLLERSGSI